jgi:mycothiol synthase
MSAPTLAGLRMRPFGGEVDLPAMVEVVNAENEADGLEERDSLEGMRAWLSSPSEQFDAARDVFVGELDGSIVAVAGGEWIDTRDGMLREHRLWGVVHPDHRRRGIGSAMLAENERRARALAATHDTDRERAYGAWAASGRPAATLLERSGYRVARWFFDMVRQNLDGLEDDPALPDGIGLRPATPDQHLAIWRANREAFRDHWGGSDESEAAMRRFLEAPDADPSLWLIAWDGDEVAGGVINSISPGENEALGLRRGWLSSVFTRRAWRRRGLASALIRRSLRVLRDRGMTSAALGVDAENPLGAFGLYESVGFAVTERFGAWRKPIEAPR